MNNFPVALRSALHMFNDHVKVIKHKRLKLIKKLETLFRSEMSESFLYTDLTLEQMSNSSWVTEYGENLKESVSSNLS